MKSVVYSKIGEHRGSLRIWLEGQKLSAAGVQPGQRFSLQKSERSVRMLFEIEGDHTVSRKSRNGRELPVIDVRGRQLEGMFRANDRVRVVVSEGRIEVTLHHHQRTEGEREARISERINLGQPIIMGSLAHGGGVLDHAIHSGLKLSGVSSKLAFANEIEPDYLNTSIRNNPVWSKDSLALEGPMEDLEWNLLPKIDLLMAGLPCTGASLSGRAKNGLKAAEEHETAGTLFYAFLQAVSTLKPAVVVLENVPPYQNTVSMTVIRAVLHKLGYDVQEAVLNGKDFGALEHRSRLCMVASSQGLGFPSLETLVPTGVTSQKLGAVLDEVAEDDQQWKTFSYLAEKEVRDKLAGKGFRRQIVTPDSESVGTIGRGYAKARSTEPFVAHPTNPEMSRLLTPVEHARVKTIPATLVDGVSSTIAHEILGQSIIHDVFKAVGAWIGEALLIQRAQLQAAA